MAYSSIAKGIIDRDNVSEISHGGMGDRTRSQLRRADSAALGREDSMRRKVARRRDITAAEFANFQRLFNTFDVDHSGYLEFDELQFMLQCLGIVINETTMERLESEFDEDGDGTLDFNEFVSFMLRSTELQYLRVVSEEEERAHVLWHSSKRFNPDTITRWVWEVVMLLTTGYFALRLPIEWWSPSPFDATSWVFESLMTAFMLLDVAIIANTAVQDQGKGVDDLVTIISMYAKGRLIPDLLGALPIDLLIAAGTADRHHELTVWYIFRALRLLRLVRTLDQFRHESVTGVLDPTMLYLKLHISPLIKISFFFVVIVHTLVIVWLLIVGDALSALGNGSNIPDTHWNYADGLYLVVYTLTTVGYGDLIIRGTAQRLYCVGLFLGGAVVNGIVIAQMSSFLQKADIKTERQDKMRETLAVLRHFDIPREIQSEILSFQAHVLEHNLGSSHEELISSLPQTIQDRLSLYMRIKYISMVPMFNNASSECKFALAHHLENMIFHPGEFIIIAGEQGREMYFLGHGVADVIHPKGAYLATLRKGNFFGEIALIVEEARRTASIKALTYCDVFRLKKNDFGIILEKFPAFKVDVEREMEERVKQFQATNNGPVVPKREKKRKPKKDEVVTIDSADDTGGSRSPRSRKGAPGPGAHGHGSGVTDIKVSDGIKALAVQAGNQANRPRRRDEPSMSGFGERKESIASGAFSDVDDGAFVTAESLANLGARSPRGFRPRSGRARAYAEEVMMGSITERDLAETPTAARTSSALAQTRRFRTGDSRRASVVGIDGTPNSSVEGHPLEAGAPGVPPGVVSDSGTDGEAEPSKKVDKLTMSQSQRKSEKA